ncbi:hypothetical protein TWF569_002578 [Orbilia oligospora]|uniref:SRP9 domain-containing protein n=1 Tax=Orbilia oligospora TaxID=2813651 RepID=A0A7C8NFV6_ORBOL|nr:hypothetical protein TWF102_002926 [Orbilia oligospora]KAF3103284.1 hypothetical protein TWF103_007275 [Orbilia oligospora]KAF3105697.1 hypothetical protein TWF706_003798 [Orbilia oligospora]KAF3120553.1 hypothetical protein TWF703_002556 [Orbilia oligospora]KAF3121448.1 hypothetical protein TWF569_002578 [Orbilia oligospora]
MVLVKTPLDFIERSVQLLQAHPATTRITTTYNISPAPTTPSRRPKPTSSKSTTTVTQTEEKPKLPRGTLTLKTYDPISGSLIKLRTDKIADVGRIVTGLHRLARSMAGLKDLGSGEVTAAAATAGGTAETAGPSVIKDAVAGAVAATEGGEAAAGGSKGGKKKNKKKK